MTELGYKINHTSTNVWMCKFQKGPFTVSIRHHSVKKSPWTMCIARSNEVIVRSFMPVTEAQVIHELKIGAWHNLAVAQVPLYDPKTQDPVDRVIAYGLFDQVPDWAKEIKGLVKYA